jgi:hypothetical protein
MIFIDEYIWKLILKYFTEIPTQDDIANLYYRKMTRAQILTEARLVLQSILLVSKQFYSITTTYMSELKEIYNLMEKYPKNQYESAHYNNPARSSILLDALFTGCDLPYASHTFRDWSKEIEDDIKRTIQLIPETLNNDTGVLRCRCYITPFAAACYNTNIPLHIIEYMLSIQPNIINAKICLNGKYYYVLEDNFAPIRSDIVPLFKKYIKYALPSLQIIINQCLFDVSI